MHLYSRCPRSYGSSYAQCGSSYAQLGGASADGAARRSWRLRRSPMHTSPTPSSMPTVPRPEAPHQRGRWRWRRGEDERWRPEKLIYDLTWCMPVAAWQRAVSNLQVREQRCLAQIWKAHKKAGDPLLQSIISEYNTWGPDNKIWESLGIPISYTRCPAEGSHVQGSSVPPPAVATATRHAEQNSVPPPVAAPTTPLPKIQKQRSTIAL